MRITCDSNVSDLIKSFEVLEKDVAYVQMSVINDLAFHAQKSVKQEVKHQLHISKGAIASFTVKKAKKTNLFAVLHQDTWKADVLEHNIRGGDRSRKGMEKAMIYNGYMSEDEILTPSPGTKIKSYVYTQMMSQLKLNYKAGYLANETKRSRKRKGKRGTAARFWIVGSFSRSHLSPGVYARMPGYNKPICILRISKRPSYRKKVNLDAVVQKVVDRNITKYYKKAVDKALQLNKSWAK
jgi:hypothetical protein